MTWVPFWPAAASNTANVVDSIFVAFLALAVFICFLLFALIIRFSVRYRIGSGADRSDRVKKTWHWEIGWTTATLVGFLVLFAWGAGAYIWLYQPPGHVDEIYVVAKQWMWKTQHPGGQREINELHLPVDRPVRLVMTSQDVIHSFYVPAFRVKHDVLPGTYEVLWFKPVRKGVYRLECAEYCGSEHATMGGRIIVMDPADYEKWLVEQGPSESLAEQGEALFRQYGCSGCHGGHGTVRAPPLEGLYGHVVPLEGGGTVIADERYVRDSILLPKSQVAAGYAPVMPSFAGQIGEDDLVKLIAYIKSLANKPRPSR
jgi:cytochrome c oxidase subunit 2